MSSKGTPLFISLVNIIPRVMRNFIIRVKLFNFQVKIKYMSRDERSCKQFKVKEGALWCKATVLRLSDEGCPESPNLALR